MRKETKQTLNYLNQKAEMKKIHNTDMQWKFKHICYALKFKGEMN